MEKILFARMTKVSAATGEFWAEVKESPEVRGNEIFDYDASKPLIKAWSDDIYEHSGGLSYGNLRAMHNPKVAAGLLKSLTFNDLEKKIEIHGEVVDSEEREKLLKGVYTGLSFGGDYDSKKVVGGQVRYAAKPVEISLADLPMGTENRFIMVKATGEEVEMEFQKAAEAGEMQKGMYAVGDLAQVLQTILYLAQEADWESKYELDKSPVAEQLKVWLQQGGEILKAMAAEEVDELIKDLMTKTAEAGQLADPGILVFGGKGRWLPLAKVGAAISAKNKDHVQQIHDHAAALGATCGGENMGKVAEAKTLAKVAALEAEITAKDGELAAVSAGLEEQKAELAKVSAGLEEKEAELAKVAGEKAALQTEVTELRKQPAPAKAALRESLYTLSKEEDGLGKTAMVTKPKTPEEAIVLAHQNPFIIT